MQHTFPSRGYRIIDAHTHIFPHAIAAKATENIGNFYGVRMQGVGEPYALAESMRETGISHALVFSAATTPKQVQHINEYITACCAENPSFTGFGTLHPYMEEVEREVERCKRLGLRGFKFHPDLQQFYIDEPRAVEMLRIIDKYHMPVLFHMGDERYTYSAPERLRNVADKFPDLMCIGAHFGGYRQWDAALKYLVDGRIYFDTSSTLSFVGAQRAVDMLHYFGVERFMFGTDFPMWEPGGELERFFALKLTEEERNRILHGTFEELFGAVEK